MLIKIKDIPAEGLSVRQALGRGLLQEALQGMSADLDRSRAEADLTLSKSGEDVILRGDVRGEVAVPCVRCLQTVLAPIDGPVMVVFTPDEIDDEAGEEDEEAKDDVEYVRYTGHDLDLDETLREALILAVPMTPLCKPSCKGLCPVCGGDRNVKDCGCREQPLEDPRLAPLKGLKL